MFRREAPSLSFLDSSMGIHGGRRARRLPRTSSLDLALCLLFQRGIHFRAGAAAHIFLRICCSGLLGARSPCLGLGDQPLLPPLTEADTGPQCCPDESGLVVSVGCFQTSPVWTCGLLLLLLLFFFLANSHQASLLHWPQLYSFLWRKRVSSPSPRGLGVKQQLLTEP